MKQEKANILLVEDEENLHETLKMNLEMEGYSVTSAYDGNEAMKMVQDEYFDLIIMDIMLPEIDGISITENLRLDNNDVPILMLSAKSTGQDRVLGLKKGDEIKGKTSGLLSYNTAGSADKKATRKIKEEAAGAGAPFILMTSDKSDGFGVKQSIKKGIAYSYK